MITHCAVTGKPTEGEEVLVWSEDDGKWMDASWEGDRHGWLDDRGYEVFGVRFYMKMPPRPNVQMVIIPEKKKPSDGDGEIGQVPNMEAYVRMFGG
jgi:hypothetical protein